jgi:phosphoribosylformylglycinamidine synthase subunit PurSL
MLWEVDIYPAVGQRNLLAESVVSQSVDLGLGVSISVEAVRGYLIQGDLTAEQVERIAAELLADSVAERTVVAQVGDSLLSETPESIGKEALLIHVLPKPGVTDTVAESARSAIADFKFEAEAVRTFKKYWIAGVDESGLAVLGAKLLANDAIEQTFVGPLGFDKLEVGSDYKFELIDVPIRQLDDEALMELSLKGQLYLQLAEMQTIREYFKQLDRDPTDIELETIAQTWSEHCSHKTLAGRIHYTDESHDITFDNMLKETIFAATQKIRADFAVGDGDWCVGVFEDNAGIVRFDDDYNIVFKVETHNHPSALEPYGGANTGIGGVIRDPMGTGMGARPVCNTDVFCFAPPETPAEDLPGGVLHPRRVMRGVVEGVRDYGNRMGIPTINGAVYFDPRYLGNPLVYCGDVGLVPREKSFKKTLPNDMIVAMGGRTGRDGIHGATFSSAELTHESDELSGGAVQIGNAITEKMVLDIMMVAQERELYTAVTDCGAGGFSSAVGEMGEKIGAEVWLEACPLKYAGLSYTEIWISEAQERMVFSVPEEKVDELLTLCESEGVEATVIGRFVPTGQLELKYEGETVGKLAMEFLHDGRPPVIREACFTPPKPLPVAEDALSSIDPVESLKSVLGSLNVASKHWVVRQYDHEVQGGSVIKPLVGVENDGPGDASVFRPVLDSRQGVVVSCGMNPHFGDLDTYHMAASAIDEAVRNCVAVGADPSRIAILDNFCWGNTERPETLGSLVRAALACYDVSTVLQTPFISGKDSLNNEFRPEGADEPISIPPSLLISAMGQVDDVSKCVTMDLKSPGNLLYQVGLTRNEMGGSHLSLVNDISGGKVPEVDAPRAKATFAALHRAIDAGLVRACHDLSEGGLAVAAAEMAFAGQIGATIDLATVPNDFDVSVTAGMADVALLFAESNTRFLCEVTPENGAAFEETFKGLPCAKIGQTNEGSTLVVEGGQLRIEAKLDELKKAWQEPLDW